MQLYNFFRSGTSHRLRIALNLKGLAYDYIPVSLASEEHLGAAFKAINPQGLVPALVDDGRVLIQSPAIIEWLEERHPTPPLLPANAEDRARVRALAAIVGCDIHPINNRRILEYLRKTLGHGEAAVSAWCATWIDAGFAALENLLAADTARGEYCFGGAPGLADVYLVPQVESARRFKLDLAPYPNILAIDAACNRLDAFRLAAPALQPDAPRP
ncbi:MAG: maleylacetoacetate isomerase [Rhodocyclales bacterium]|nr:maleylacetoacetate isomerase [Rhodocyclales bacterium]